LRLLVLVEIEPFIFFFSVIIVAWQLIPATLGLCFGGKGVIVQEEVVVIAVQLQVKSCEAIFSGLNISHAVLALLLCRPAHLLARCLALLWLLVVIASVIFIAIIVTYEVVLLWPAGALANTSAYTLP
jgi:hypothetical protein